MIKSYKFVLIIEAIILVLLWIFKPYISFDGDKTLETSQVFFLAFLPTIVIVISILLQKVVVSVINSDTVSENFSEGKIWKISFFANLLFAVVCVIGALIISVLQLNTFVISTHNFTQDIAGILLTLLIASFVIATFLIIRKTVWEVNKIVGTLMVFIAVVVFLASVYVPAVGYFYLNKNYDDSVEIPVEANDSADEITELADEPEEENTDFYSLREQDFSAIETGGYFTKFYERGIDEKMK